MMFYSMGNLLGNHNVGMLFVNFEKPHRLRLQGIASVNDNDPLLEDYAEAQLIVRVALTEIFRNCPRSRDRARVEREGALISRAEYEKYLTEVASREP